MERFNILSIDKRDVFVNILFRKVPQGDMMPHLTGNIFEDLKEFLKGDLYTDKLRRLMHSTDGSIFKVEPIAVVYPKNRDDVLETVNFAKKYGFSIHSRGAGSGLCGSAIGQGIILDFSKYMNRLIEINFDEKYFICEPGYRFGELEAVLKGKGLFFPPDPSSGEYATFGGMYGTNASGAHSVKYGNVADYILDAEIVLSNGEVYSVSALQEAEYDELPEAFKELYDLYVDNEQLIESSYPNIRYNVAGYNLKNLVKDGKLNIGKLLAGSEGTLAIVTKLKFRLEKKPDFDTLVVAYFDDIISSAKAVQKLMPLKPAGIEIMDKSLLRIAKESDESLRDKIPHGIDNVLLIEFDSYDKAEAEENAILSKRILEEERLASSSFLAIDEEDKSKFWAIRKAAVPILYKLKGEKKILALIEDAAVPLDNLVEYFQGTYSLLEKYQVDFVVYGHIAKGLMHTRPLLNLKNREDVQKLKLIADDFFEMVHSLGGAISGEHGDGRIRSCYIAKQYGEIYPLFLKVKKIFDGKNNLNPDIKTENDEYQVMKNLRYGEDYKTVDTGQQILKWDNKFYEEIEKCHGCSKCTTITTATRMCPIYKFTRDEAAAPKAKANILRYLISGEIDSQSIFEDAFQYVIDHCVNCGSCYKECPSNVNIPKMAIEARSRYVKKYGSTLEKRLLVSAELAGRYTRKFSKLLNLPMHSKLIRSVAERLTGISANREPVEFPKNCLYERVKRYEGEGNIKVLYFAGCYASYIRPEIGEAAIKVLKSLGIQVVIPNQHCCGLPMLSKGMADAAREKITENLHSWKKLVYDVDYIVVTCSSCGLSLSEEWSYLTNDTITAVIKQKLIHISSLVNRYMGDRKFKAPNNIKLSYHMPCHLKVQKDSESSIKMLSSIENIDVENLNSHCCGMAGSWGISAKNYDLSIKIGSPMTEKLNNSNSHLGVTDCPTCRIQMEHMSAKSIKHPIEILAECLDT
ncbi:MAG: anaerobic glycerol-3-phosphate dehydrogenase subunit C [Calditerrivibrio sp.]|nr:anaerobic glycerol-3-phosphate dehydrogenase subunit C [Calditerrivibrio sp.]